MAEYLLGRILHRMRRPVTVTADRQYIQVGLRSFGRGFFIKEAVAGAALGKKKIFRLADGDLVFNIVFAWEGAVGLATPVEDGHCASHRFPTYRVDELLCHPRWLEEALRSKGGVRTMAACSPGSAGRNRTLNQEALLGRSLRLPEPEMQLEAVRAMDAAIDYAVAAKRVSQAADAACRAVLQAEADRLRLTQPTELLGDLADLNIGRTPSRADARYWTSDLSRPFCTIASMGDRSVVPTKEGVTEFAEAMGKARRVPAGSLLMSFKLSLGKVGFAATDVFPNEAIVWVEPRDADRTPIEFLAPVLSTTDFRPLTGEAVKGKTLNKSSLARIPVPRVSEQQARRLADLARDCDAYVEAARAAALASEQAVTHLRETLFADVFLSVGSLPSSTNLVAA